MPDQAGPVCCWPQSPNRWWEHAGGGIHELTITSGGKLSISAKRLATTRSITPESIHKSFHRDDSTALATSTVAPSTTMWSKRVHLVEEYHARPTLQSSLEHITDVPGAERHSPHKPRHAVKYSSRTGSHKESLRVPQQQQRLHSCSLLALSNVHAEQFGTFNAQEGGTRLRSDGLSQQGLTRTRWAKQEYLNNNSGGGGLVRRYTGSLQSAISAVWYSLASSPPSKITNA